MGVRSYLSGIWDAVRGHPGNHEMDSERRPRWNTEPERYAHLRAYRSDEDLYGRIRRELKNRGYAGYKNIRNPAHALAELYAYKLPDGTLDNLECPEALKPLIEQILTSSNWENQQEVAARDYAVTGDLYLKAANDADAFFQWLDPAHVTECDEDRKGYVTFCRLDIPQERRTGEGETEDCIETEVWDKEAGYHAVWEHDGSHATRLADLLKTFEADVSGLELTVYEELAESAENAPAYTGFDFVPIVHRKLRDTGGERGEGAYQHGLGDIDQNNEMATRFHNILFPETALAFTRGTGPDGAELPSIRLEEETPEDRIARLDAEAQKVVEMGSVKAIRLPSGSDVKTLIPQTQIEAHARVLEEQIHYVENQVLPELQYRSLKSQGELSGRAAKYYLADSVDRIGGARRKYDDGIVRAIQMALSIWKVMEFDGHERIPDYEARRDEIRITPREVFPLSELDKAEEDQKRASIRQTYLDMGLLRFRLEEEGVDEARITEVMGQVAESRARGGSARSPLEEILGNTPT